MAKTLPRPSLDDVADYMVNYAYAPIAKPRDGLPIRLAAAGEPPVEMTMAT